MNLITIMPSLPQLVNNNYQSVKTAETECIIKKALSGLTSVSHPCLRQVSGIPGSGKSTFCQMYLEPNYLFLSFDKIMMELKSYQKLSQTEGEVVAYTKCEMPARIIGYEILKRAINKHYNILLEHSGANPAHLELFQNILKLGYQTKVDFIICDTNLAIKRTQERQKIIQRYIPETTIIERADKLKTYIADYKKIVAKISFFDGMNNFKPLS